MKRLILLSLAVVWGSILYAQSFRVSGVVRDKATTTPLPGVLISEMGTKNGGVSDLLGEFSFEVSGPEAEITFFFVGYRYVTIPVKNRSNIEVELEEKVVDIDDIVITALSVPQESKALGYAIQTLGPMDVAEVKSPNFVDNLAGKVAGVTVSQGATGVGSTSKITIRGEASFTNNNPLFVVDGTPINNNSIVNFTDDAAAGFQEIDFGNGGMEVNADDIASVSVLKGPGAAALYGTRASNGVILITTKNGANQKGLGISFNSSTTFDRAFQLPKFQNLYGQGNSGQFEFVDGLGGGVNDNISYSWGPQLDVGNMIPQYDSPVATPDGQIVRGGDVAVHGGAPITPTPFISHPDNLKNFYQTGITTTNNIAFSSGSEKGNFRLSYTDLRSQSIIPGVNLDRNNVNARLGFKPVEGLSVFTTLNYVHSQSDNRPSNGYGSENVNYSLVAWGPRSLDIAAMEDYWQPGLENIQQYSFNYTYFDNPYFILHENRNSFKRDRLFGNMVATYEFSPSFSVMVRSGMDYSGEQRKFRRAFSTNRFKSGAYGEHAVNFRENNTDFLFNFNEYFGDFRVNLNVGGNRMDQFAESVQTQALSLAQPGIFSLSNAASPLEVNQFASRKRINSLYAFANLEYNGFLFLDLTGRNDWSSALATPTSSQNTSFFYPGASLSYVLSEMVHLPASITFAKLRASWAQVGNDTDPFQTAGVFQAQTPYQSNPTFSGQATIANANLLPERTTSIEFGTDLRFLNDKLRFSLTYYNATTENQIISLPIPVSSGYSQQVVNGGQVRSRGLEVIAGITPFASENFRWDATLNFSRNVSTVEELPGGLETLTLAYSRVYDNVNQTVWFQVQEGGQIGDMYGTGYMKTDDGRFIVDSNGNLIADNDLQLLGNYNPDFILGFSNNFRYKNFDLGFVFDWRQGGILVSRTLSLAAVGGQLIETEDRPDAGIIVDGVMNTGTTESPVYVENTTAIPAETYYRQFYDRNHEENNVYDASYLKLRQFSLGYTFRSEREEGFFRDGRSLRLAFFGRNLFALSHIPHFDPEQIAVQGNSFVSGVEDMSYATTRSLGIKIGLDF